MHQEERRKRGKKGREEKRRAEKGSEKKLKEVNGSERMGGSTRVARMRKEDFTWNVV